VVNEVAELYELLEKITLLRYVMRFLQWEHGLPALEFLHRLVREVDAHPYAFPEFLRRRFRSPLACVRTVFEDPDPFHASMWRFCCDVLRLPLEGDDAALAVWQLNAAVVPRRGRRYPIEVECHWDVLGYFADCRAPAPGEKRQLLPASPPILFEIRDPKGAQTDYSSIWIFTDALRFFELDWPCNQIATAAAFHPARS
jgi:hypothetical protein